MRKNTFTDRIPLVANFFREFKEFAMRGNVVDLAVGIILGAGFNGVVNSFVKDIVMPPIGMITGKGEFSGLYINLSGELYQSLAAAKAAGAPVIAYGEFFNVLISFLI